MITNAGSGYQHLPGSRRDPLARGRRRARRGASSATSATSVAASSGRPVSSRSAGLPTRMKSVFAADKATFRRRDADIETLLEVIVSPEQAVEVRRITLTNHDSQPRELELTSYAEVVLAPHGADLAHPAFGKLFLETEWVPGPNALLCRRRPRRLPLSSRSGPCTFRPWTLRRRAARRSAVLSMRPTDCAFLGRGRTPANPAALDPDSVLSGTAGPVLDPVFSLRRRFRLEPRGSAVIALATAFADFALRGAGTGRPISRGRRGIARLRAGLGPQPGRASTR